MMQTVWKFEFAVNDQVHVMMPKGAKVLHLEAVTEGKQIVVWALCDPNAEQEERVFYVRGTGHKVEDYLTHVGTCVSYFVWHVFERRA